MLEQNGSLRRCVNKMKLPERVELKGSDAKYLYKHDIKEFFGAKSWERYVYMNRFCTIINFTKKHLPMNSAIVDVGSAQGNFSLTLAKSGYEVYGVDIRPSFISYAKLKATEEEKSNVEWICSDAKNLPFQSNFADSVLLLEILEHTRLPEKMVEEACRILKKGGYLIVSTVNQKRIRTKSKPFSYSDFKKGISKIDVTESTAKGSEHIFEFQERELLMLLAQFNLRISYTKTMTFLGFHFLAKLFDHKVLSRLERKLLKTYYLKEKFGLGLLVFCKKC